MANPTAFLWEHDAQASSNRLIQNAPSSQFKSDSFKSNKHDFDVTEFLNKSNTQTQFARIHDSLEQVKTKGAYNKASN